MRKLRLDLDALEVEAFDTSVPAANDGTVGAYDSDSKETLCVDTCPGTGPTLDPENAYCTWDACSAYTWCYPSCWTDC